jgi:membrane-bound serine protease (ClpP class)
MKTLTLIGALALACAHLPCAAQSNAVETATVTPTPSATVYVMPIQGPIERGLLYAVKRCTAEAKANGAAAIVLDMDTPGGQLMTAETIMTAFEQADVPIYTLVNDDAISAGAMIAMVSDGIYMTPRGRIGDAMPIMGSPMGGAQAIPDNLKEKIVSYTASLIRSAAQRHNHDDQLAEAMVRIEMEYKIGDEIICKEGELLTLTTAEATRIVTRDGVEAPLLAAGVADSIDELLDQVGLAGAQTIVFEISAMERASRHIEAFSFIFLALGALGIWIEIKTPGFGLPGLLGGTFLLIWLWGHHIAGLAGAEELLVIMIGLILLALEIFVIPGFGIAGVLGICCLLLGVGMAMVQHIPGGNWFDIPHFQWRAATINMGLTVGIFAIVGTLLSRILPHTGAYHKLVLETTLPSRTSPATADTPATLVGSTGQAVNDLHPSGVASIGGKRVAVVARGTFINAGSTIVVAEQSGNRVVVKQAPVA